MLKPSFTQKVSLHIVVLMLVTGISVTLMTANLFRSKLYEQEYAKAYTTYMAAANYLAGHYRTHREMFNRKILNYVLGTKFMNLEGADPAMLSHRLIRLLIYSSDGTLIYEFSRTGDSLAPTRIATSQLPTTYRHGHERALKTVHVSGPIETEGETPAYLEIVLPTTIDEDVRRLYRQSFVVVAAMLVMGIVLSTFFARRTLRPIMDLTEAARQVHGGNFTRRVKVRSGDEIGLLSSTFNEMTDAIVRRVAMNRRMQEWTMRLGGQFDTRTLLEQIMGMFDDLSGGASCRLFSFDAATGRLAAWTGGSAEADDLARLAASSNRVAPAPGERAEPACELGLPLSVGDRVLGVARLGPRPDGKAYDEEITAPLATMAQHAAVALDNIRMHRDLAAKERFEQEMKWARDIQQSMLPRSVPAIRGYEVAGVSSPAYEVGGDYFDFVEADNRWLVVIGDVSGKGVPAALIMSMLRSLIHTNAERSESPREILRRVNRLLSPDLETEMFVTVSAVALRPGEGTVRVVRAGHEPFLVIRASGEPEWVSPGGTALGLVEIHEFEASLREATFELGVGDTLVMFTDGMTESIAPGGGELGYERVGECFRRHRAKSLRAMIDGAVADVHAFTEGGDPADDMTIVAVRRVSG